MNYARFNPDGSVTAGLINGQEWAGITDGSVFWPVVEAWRAQGNTIEPYIAPEAPQSYRISKTTPWLRMTEDEAATIDGVMSQTDARLKQIYMAATYLDSADALWSTMMTILTDNFGSERAAQLLAPET